jgi:hypothetical protein
MLYLFVHKPFFIQRKIFMISKKYSSFFFLILFCLPYAHGMQQQGKQITEPYIPDRNSTDLVDLLLTNPRQVSIDIHKTYANYINKLNKASSLVEQKQIFQSCLAQNSLFLLAECPSPCSLGRKDKPYVRSMFENRVCTILCDKIATDPIKTIHVASFGSGGGLVELIITAKTLALIPNADLHFHFIEQDDWIYTHAKKFVGQTPQINIQGNASINGNQFAAYIKNLNTENIKIKEYQKKSNAELFFLLMSELMHISNTRTCWLKWLQHTFPQAKISLSLYDTYKDYLTYVEYNKLPYPEIAMAVDICDSIGTAEYSHVKYNLLCREILRQNPTASNIWLDRNSHNNDRPGLISFSFDRIHEYSIPITSNDGKKIFGYKTVEPTMNIRKKIKILQSLWLMTQSNTDNQH